MPPLVPSTSAWTWRWRSLSGLRPPTRGRRERYGDEAALDTGVRRILAAKYRLGLFDDPYVDEDRAREVLADPQHREVARVAAERAAVLLRMRRRVTPGRRPTDLHRGDRAIGRFEADTWGRGCSTTTWAKP